MHPVSYQNLIYQKKDGIAKIAIHRPEVMNALTPAVLLEMKSAVEAAQEDHEVGVIVITGSGNAFCAGIDLKSLEDQNIEGGAIGPILDDPGRDLIDAIQNVSKAVIAMVNGYCITGGLEIALACDLIIASKVAKFADTHVRWGLRCSWGMSQRLPMRIGWLKAKELTFTANMISAQEAERINLVNRVVPADKLEETVQDLARKIMSNSLESVAAHKYLYNRSIAYTLKKGLDLEAKSRFIIRDTQERLEKFIKKKSKSEPRGL